MIQVKMSEGGRVVIPAEIRQALGLKVGEPVLFELKEGEAVITSRRAQLERARALVRQHVPANVSLVDELILERRAAAHHE
ncbi:MAG: AbrB/MazE/SpoVT family DNA-binding domain-containing protein [Rhodocyclaceae bacterium]|nr:AbrB/MazE/SpoVT family DNA-binding domain-containing protein [Rhodocyclaceae bacterium]